MSDVKFSCDGCGQHIVCDAEFIGCETACPNCQLSLNIPFASRSGPPLLASAPTPRTIEIYGTLVIGVNCLGLLLTSINLLRFATAMEGPGLVLLAILTGGPSVMLGVLGIRLGLGLQRGEQIAVIGTFIVAALQFGVWWFIAGLAFEQPVPIMWRLLALILVAALIAPLAFSARRNWQKLHRKPRGAAR